MTEDKFKMKKLYRFVPIWYNPVQKFQTKFRTTDFLFKIL